MAERAFRAYEPSQPVVLPSDPAAWLPVDHAIYLLSDLVDALDLSPITAGYHQGDGGGNPPYHPVLVTKLLFHGYSEGVVSSRQIAAKTVTDVAYRVLTRDQHPDFRTISDFRERHLGALSALFVQVVRLAGRLGLVKLEQVAQDGTKVLANASKHRAMSYARMQQTEARLSREIQALLAAAQAADAAEDARYGRACTGDELPVDLSGEIDRRAKRLATIRTAQAALEAEAQAEADAIRAADVAERQRRAQAGAPQKPGRPPAPSATPQPQAQRNFTDPDSRIMKNADKAFVQAYNGQLAVDAGSQLIVGCLLSNQSADAPHLAPMVEQVQATLGQVPAEWSADAAYFSAANVATVEATQSTPLIPPDRQRHRQAALPAPVAAILAAADPPALPATEPAAPASAPESVTKATMRARLQTAAGRAAYARRKITVEPVIGQLKACRGLRTFLLRGLAKVSGEWTLWCLTHNLRKLLAALRADPLLHARLLAV